MGGGSLAEGRRQRDVARVAPIADIARHRRDRKAKPLTTKDTKEHKEEEKRISSIRWSCKICAFELRDPRQNFIRPQAGGMIIDGGSDHEFVSAGSLNECFQ